MGIELFLNLVWLATGVIAFAVMPRRSPRALFAMAAAVVLLFPFVSISDDFARDRDSLEEALAIITLAILLLIALIAVARIDCEEWQPPAIPLAPATDPRSPPLR